MVFFLFPETREGDKASRGWKGGYLKQKKYVFFTISILLSLILSIQVYAVGDGNLDGGGGSMGQGTSQNSWSPGNEGVRVTVIRAESHDPVTRPIDLTNKHPNITYSFGKVSKMSVSYTHLGRRSGSRLLYEIRRMDDMKKKLWIMVCVAVPLTMIAAIIYHNRK